MPDTLKLNSLARLQGFPGYMHLTAVATIRSWHATPNWRCIALYCAMAMLLAACGPGGSGEGIDPGIVDIPIAFIKRPIPVDDMGDQVQADLRDPLLFSAGGDVFLQR